MLTEFLLENKFPASCFASPRGGIATYELKNNLISIQLYKDNGITDKPIHSTIKIINIPHNLFKIHIETYLKILNILKTTSLSELQQKHVPLNPTWEQILQYNITKRLPNSIIEPHERLAKMTSQYSQSEYGIPKGEIVYILSETSTQLGIKSVDGIKKRIKKDHAKIITSIDQKKFIKNWNKHLKTIIKEYNNFINENKTTEL